VAIVRSLMKYVSIMALGLGCLWMLWDPQNQTWHDKVPARRSLIAPPPRKEANAASRRIRKPGELLFRWRSYLPLALAPLLVWALVDAGFARQSPSAGSRLPGDLLPGFGVRILVAGHAPAELGRNVAKQELGA